MIIDCHTHVFPPQIRENRSQYVHRDPSFALLYADEKAKMITADELVAIMDKEGIDVSVIVNFGWSTHQLCVDTNDYILEAIARYPQRLIGFGTFHPQSPEAALDEIERCAKGGMRGIGEIRPDTQFPSFTDAGAMQPFVEALRKHQLILLTHASEPAGHNYPGKGAVTPDVLYPFITSFPDLTVICAHWGGGLPFYALMPEVKRALENVYFDTAASPFLYHPRIYSLVSELVGADKILFGSDYPLIAPSRYIREINATDLPESSKQQILGDNTRRLLGITE